MYRTVWILALVLAFLGGCDYPRTQADCATDLEAMEAAVDLALEPGRVCEKDTDCVAMDISNDCYGACPVAVHRGEVDRVAAAVKEAEMAFCYGYMEQCGYTTPSCAERTPVCRAGRCEMAEPLYLYLVAPTL